jgi:hypothetical protein
MLAPSAPQPSPLPRPAPPPRCGRVRSSRRGFSVVETAVALAVVVALAAAATAVTGRASTRLGQHVTRMQLETVLVDLSHDLAVRPERFSVELILRYVCPDGVDVCDGFDAVVVGEPSQRPGQLSIAILDDGMLLAAAMRTAGPEQPHARCVRGWLSASGAPRVRAGRSVEPCLASPPDDRSAPQRTPTD